MGIKVSLRDRGEVPVNGTSHYSRSQERNDCIQNAFITEADNLNSMVWLPGYKNDLAHLPPASITKMLTLLIAAKRVAITLPAVPPVREYLNSAGF